MKTTTDRRSPAAPGVPAPLVGARRGWRRPAAAARAAAARGFAPVGGDSLAVWRVTVGGGLAFWALKQLRDRGDGRTWAEGFWVDPPMHFTYAGFAWVAAPPEPYLSMLVVGVMLAGLALAAGLFTRVSAALAATGFTWLVLIERTTYQNHYYLLTLVAWAAVALPLGAAWSADNRRLRRPARAVPRWAVWLVRFQVGLPYFYGGLAKLEPHWLSGEPMANMLYDQQGLADTWLAPLTDFLPGGSRADLFPDVALAFAYGGLLFDLLIVPALLWRKSRLPAYAAAVLFHLMNATLFTIGVFPWFMIAATLIFFPPDWPRRLLRAILPGGLAARLHLVGPRAAPGGAAFAAPGVRARATAATLLGLYVMAQCLIPLRHHLYAGSPNWTEAGHLFSWHMKLRGKRCGVRLTAEFADGTVAPVDLRGYVTPYQAMKFGGDPELVRQLAAHLRNEPLVVRSRTRRAPDGGATVVRWAHRPDSLDPALPLPPGVTPEALREAARRPVAVRALVLCCYNERRPQLLLDPTVDLSSAEPPAFGAPDWVMPLVRPPRTFTEGPWREDVRLWDSLVETDPAVVRAAAAAQAR